MDLLPLLAGYAEVEITPPLGGSIPGYFRDRRATGAVLNPLMAKVLALRQGDESIALVACDLLWMGAHLVQRIRAAVAGDVPDAPAHVWIHCTHTHTGGFTPPSFTSDTEKLCPGFFIGETDAAWVDTLVERITGAVGAAMRGLAQERRLSLHEGCENSVAFYRRFVMRDGTVRTNPGRGNPEVVRAAGEIDPRLHLLRFKNRRILVVIYGLHPDTLGGTKYSSDYPGLVCRGVRSGAGSEWRVLFLNAACGNINHIDVQNPEQRSGPAETVRIAQALSRAAVAALGTIEPLRPELRVRSCRVEARLRRPAPADLREAERRIREGGELHEFNGLFAHAAVVLDRTADTSHTAEIAALRLGGFGLAAVPGEFFVELAREAEAAAGLGTTRVLGLTNGSMGYIPTARAHEEGGYEVGYRSARYVPETGHQWAAAAAGLLGEAT